MFKRIIHQWRQENQDSRRLERTVRSPTAAAATFASLLRAAEDFNQGKCIHHRMIQDGYGKDSFLGNLLVQMYGRMGSVDQAQAAFQGLQNRNVYSWTIMLSAYAQNGHYREALELYHLMNQEGVEPDLFVFSSILGVCSVLGRIQEGRKIHERLTETGLESDTVLQNALLNMYAKEGCLDEARAVFHKTDKKDVVSWNLMMSSYSQEGKFAEAMEVYREMVSSCEASDQPDHVSYVTAISACCALSDLEQGRAVHAQAASAGGLSVAVQSALINLYGKCRSLSEARSVFDRITCKNQVSWNTMIAAYAQQRHTSQVIDLYRKMVLEGVEPSKLTYLSIVGSYCDDRKNLAEVHKRIIDAGFGSDVMIGTSLIDAYAHCGQLENARSTFDGMKERNVFTWNAVVGAYIQNEKPAEAIDLFHEMELEGVKPNEITLLVLLGACNSTRADHLQLGKQIHARIGSSGYQSSTLQNSLINMYAKCGSLQNSRKCFEEMVQQKKTVVSWNAMIAAYVSNIHDAEALDLYKQMPVEPNNFTFATILGACANLGALNEGKAVHEQIIKAGSEDLTSEFDQVVATALINMYGKCENINNARLVFDKQKYHNSSSTASWNAMISAYAVTGLSAEAFEIFQKMELEGIRQEGPTYLSLLAACSCGTAGMLSRGETVHSRLSELGLDTEVTFGTALTNMYSRCGSLANAKLMFEKVILWNDTGRNPISWTAMFAAYAHHSCPSEALELLRVMNLQGVAPNEINFTSILNACSHGGLRIEAVRSFQAIQADYGIQPAAEHFVCISDMLGRAGLVAQAEDLIRSSPFQPHAVAWQSLLSACRIHGDADVAARSAGKIVEMEPEQSAPYLLLVSGIHNAAPWDQDE